MAGPSASPRALPLRVAVVGARCRRQGIGAHLSRFFGGRGCDVVGVSGTSLATAAEAADALARQGLARPAPYGEAARMVRDARPDLLVIASPHETHEAHLRLALAEGLHVLCEKPLCWGGADPVLAAEDLARAFAAAGRHLFVGCQWPFTLETYRALHPGVLDRAPRTFSMRLSPRTRGVAMLPDALPHALSLLHAVLPDAEARVEGASLRVLDSAGEALEVRFLYRASGHAVASSVEMRTRERAPRPAAYAFDGREARREVDLDGYRMTFHADGRSLPLPDPTPRLVERVVDAVLSGVPPRVDPAAVPGMRNLARLCAAATVAGARR